MAREDPQLKFRVPADLRARIERVAAENNRSVSAELVATLEQAYPPKTLNLDTLVEFFESMVSAESSEDALAYLEEVNDALAKTRHPFTVKAGWDGVIQFYPYASPKDAATTGPEPSRPKSGLKDIHSTPDAKPRIRQRSRSGLRSIHSKPDPTD